MIFREATPNDDIFDQATQATDMEIMSDNNDSDASEDLLGDDEDDLILDEHDQEDPGDKGQKSPTRINESDEDMFEGNISDTFCEIIVFYFKTFSFKKYFGDLLISLERSYFCEVMVFISKLF